MNIMCTRSLPHYSNLKLVLLKLYQHYHCGINVVDIPPQQEFYMHSKPTTIFLLVYQINLLIVFPMRFTKSNSISPQSIVVII
ncbi:hypothetical protein MtrunA17_Chr2g0324091 [Medicago truncatula]|uniref:Uncharacterized protein n=1 Tax=Medicago truncatula TaxID=3880 RepID=A0A072VBV8_MEDTR|nr:hypothetical protein MTR_2g090215 [Medicago truncatula]RHN75701.1 hypothetical protein MtrunA17_Chr2g0324091 [Medicago truncatula]